jgi:hypothetical protein
MPASLDDETMESKMLLMKQRKIQQDADEDWRRIMMD